MNRPTKRTSGARLVGLLALLWLGLALIGPAHAGTTYYYYTDAQGTVLAKADAQGNIIARYDYKPYGAKLPGPQTKGPTGYTGHVNDAETGLVYMQARYYDPVVGRFLSVDPVGPKPGNGFGFNRYDYASNNPINHIDPDGRCPDGMCGEMLKAHVQWRMSHPNAPIDRIEKVGFVGLGAMLTASGLGALVEVAQGSAILNKVLSDSAEAGPGKPLGDRVSEVHGALDPIAQKQRTTAGLDTAEGARIIGSGAKRDLTPAQRQMLGSGETAAKMPGAHAEVTVLNQAAKDGVTPKAMETTRTICPNCKQAIERAGGKVVAPTRAEW